MKSMVWKELRENLKWALLALLGLALAEFYALSSERSTISYNSLTLCGSTFLMVSSFGCMAIGAGLGILQILPELNRDRWASLLHRPVSREAIFSGKVIAGLILYFLVTGVSLLASMAYVAIPGQFAAPFLPAMALPAASDTVMGMTFYFAALLLCLHRERWWGSRGAVAFAVLPVYALHGSQWGMWCLPLLAAIFFFAAALGAVLSNGRPQNQSKTARTALVTVLLLGSFSFLTLVTAAADWISRGNRGLNSTLFSQLIITREGQFFLQSQRGDGAEMTLKDMKGNPVTDERYLGNDRYENFIQPRFLDFNLSKSGSLQSLYLSTMPRNVRNYVYPIGVDHESKEIWYFLIEGNYFVGYDKLSRRCIGVCDAEGFKAPGAVPKPFPEPLQNSDWFEEGTKFYWVGSQLYRIEFPQRTLTPFYNSGGVRIGGASSLTNSLFPEKPPRTVVITAEGIRMFDQDLKPFFFTPILQDEEKGVMLQMADNDLLQQVYLIYLPTFWFVSPPNTEREPAVLNVLDQSGKLLQTYQNPVPSIPKPQLGWAGYLSAWTEPMVPAVWSAVWKKTFATRDFAFDEGFGLGFRIQIPEEAWPGLVVLDLALGAAIFYGARRAGLTRGRSAGWGVFTICFGVAGALAFFLAADRPQRVRCVRCGELRPIEKEICPECHGDWPLPVKDGTEILVGGN